MTGTLTNNGRIVADGGGQQRDLDLSSFGNTSGQLITNTIENTTNNGWYAQNGGRLVLAALRVSGGTGSYNWGESSGDAQIDLVNSVNLNFTGAGVSGPPSTQTSLQIDLQSSDRAAAAAPTGQTIIGDWTFASFSTFDSATLTFRYDDAAAGAQTPSIYAFNGTDWTALTSSLDTADKLISTTVSGSFASEYIVSVPEPSMLGFGAIGLAMLVRRRRRSG